MAYTVILMSYVINFLCVCTIEHKVSCMLGKVQPLSYIATLFDFLF